VKARADGTHCLCVLSKGAPLLNKVIYKETLIKNRGREALKI